ncbi:hypothetical protein GCM10009676_13780 [Prauserella halophila]|uniref:Uncharacterized protein n=1 Tax=Prauserella halophila TaxID=185641 RepID=A0ABN1W559_9PSEU
MEIVFATAVPGAAVGDGRRLAEDRDELRRPWYRTGAARVDGVPFTGNGRARAGRDEPARAAR